jgi:hypothetical protein
MKWPSAPPLTFTPAEWRHILEDGDFLDDPNNRYSVPRRLMGLPVEIVPDRDAGA